MSDTPSDLKAHISSENDVALNELLVKIQPLLAGKRFHNFIDFISLISDGIDIVDNDMVEKLSLLFERLVIVSWEGGNALNMAYTESQIEQSQPNFRSVYKLLRDPDTLRGMSLFLRTLQIIGQRVSADIPNQ
ncbi:hypothetical protein QVN42_15935 [Yersinia nurmii]|uniref:DUF1641 domain-containing protein n=1 Tax=Yersinia nurmii TaxID=685706 RepID=A0AAW7KAL5_9GAMM|nr:hypothetical protein [Yersinia nurmii]MDN0088845.1 hypothetical protein [Yersinia nurmii]CNF08920.1 Uncharacterised protein [Yersinia nurmii]